MAANKNQISKDLTSKDQRPKTKETSEGDTETRDTVVRVGRHSIHIQSKSPCTSPIIPTTTPEKTISISSNISPVIIITELS